MQAIRDIIQLNSTRLLYDLPVEFADMTVELIVLPFNARIPQKQLVAKRDNISLRGSLKNYANPSLVNREKDAWNMAGKGKHEKD